jgi:hypothetical protein
MLISATSRNWRGTGDRRQLPIPQQYNAPDKPVIIMFLATASPGIAVLTSSSTLSRRLAPEQDA